MQVKEAQLRELLSPAGFVWELTVLRSLDGVHKACPGVVGPALVPAVLNAICSMEQELHDPDGCLLGPPPAGKARGFGFAGFMCRAHAEKAIKLANGKVPPAPVHLCSPRHFTDIKGILPFKRRGACVTRCCCCAVPRLSEGALWPLTGRCPKPSL